MSDTPYMFDEHGPEFVAKREKFREFHRANPHVWDKFCTLADQLRTVDKKTSAWLVINRLRWDHYFETQGAEFKLPNDHIAFYARGYMKSAPERRGLFNIKTMAGEDFKRTRAECGV